MSSFVDIGKIIRNLILTHTENDGIFPNLLSHFDLDSMIDYEGSQGKLGILRHKQTNQKVIFKIPLNPGFSIRHEHYIMSRLRGSRKYCPNFCEEYGLIRTYVSFDGNNPFLQKDGCAMVLCDVLLSEYIPGSNTMTETVFLNKTKNIYSLIRQVLLGIEIGRMKYGFVHYDLHTDNILIRKCPQDSLFLYKLNDKKILLPTYGSYPVFIDFGFSYLKGQQGQPLYSPMQHTDAGYLACLFDPYYDARVFLMNVSKDLSKRAKTREISFRDKMVALYNHLSIDTTKGWDIKKGQYSAAEMIVYTIINIEEEDKTCKFFDIEGYSCVNILQSLITLPLKNKKNGDFRPFYRVFIKEFVKFEKTVKTNFNKLLILTQLSDSARKARADYYNKCAEEGVREFRRDFSHYIGKSLPFYQPPTEVDYAVLLESMYNMSDCFETIYFRVMKDISIQKKEQYQLPIHNLDIYDIIDVYYATEYRLYPGSTVYVWNIEKERSEKITNFTEEFCDTFNNTKNRARAELLWKHIEKDLKNM